MRWILIIGLFLAACLPMTAPSGAENPVGNSCEYSQRSGLVGQSADILAAMTFPAPMRIIKPGMAITMDYNPDRLNIDVDANNRITRVWCG